MNLSLVIDNRGDSMGAKVFRTFHIASGAGDGRDRCEDLMIYAGVICMYIYITKKEENC